MALDLDEVTRVVDEKGQWTGGLNGFEVEDLEWLGFEIQVLPGQTNLDVRQCVVLPGHGYSPAELDGSSQERGG